MTTVKIICQYTGLEFEAATRRSKNHPKINGWLQKANTDGWYSECQKAIGYGKHEGFTTIAEYNVLLAETEKAAKEHQAINYERLAKAALDRKQAMKQRDEINTTLRAAGYRWQKYNAMGALDDYKDGQWELIAPDGRDVSVTQALAEISAN